MATRCWTSCIFHFVQNGLQTPGFACASCLDAVVCVALCKKCRPMEQSACCVCAAIQSRLRPARCRRPRPRAQPGLNTGGLLIGSRPHERVSMAHEWGMGDDSKTDLVASGGERPFRERMESTFAVSQCARHHMIVGGLGVWLLCCKILTG